MNKKVNIFPRGPITGVNPPIRIPVRNITKDVKDIRKCIIAGAKVEEITPNGTILLNLQNYDIDNSNEPTREQAYVAPEDDPKNDAPVKPTFVAFSHDSKPDVIKEKIEKAEHVKQEIEEAKEKMAEQAKAVAEQEAKVEEEEAKQAAEAPVERPLTRRQRRLRAAEQLKATEAAPVEQEETPASVEEEVVTTVDPEEE